MCRPAVLDWVSKVLSEGDVRGKTILEAGSYDVNGSERPIVAALHPGLYQPTFQPAGGHGG